MPQISPMKWFFLNILTQSSIIQMVSFLSMKKSNSMKTNLNYYNIIMMNKMSWKW